MDSLWARPGTPPREGRGPSLLVASALTGALLAAAFVAGTAAPGAWWTRIGEPPVEERITYVAPPASVPIVPPRPVPNAPPAGRALGPAAAPVAPAAAAPIPAAPTIGAPAAAPVDTGGSARGTGLIRPVPGAATGAATGTGAAGAVRGPTLFPMPLRVGAELPQSAPLTNGQRDSVLRAWRNGLAGSAAVQAAIAEGKNARARGAEQASRDAARATAGAAVIRPVVGVSIPLFGGPSAAQRKRDAAIDTEVRARLASVTERARLHADSVARRDSLRLARDSSRLPTIAPRRDSL